MRKLLVPAAFVLYAFVFGTAVARGDAPTDPTKSVAILGCAQTQNGGYAVSAFSASTPAPSVTVTVGAPCGQALADLLNLNFSIRNVQTVAGTPASLVYLLVKSSGGDGGGHKSADTGVSADSTDTAGNQ